VRQILAACVAGNSLWQAAAAARESASLTEKEKPTPVGCTGKTTTNNPA